jgi:hypothetical protein
MRWFLLAVFALTMGCGDSRGGGSSSPGCTPNATQGCLCASGGMGVQTCDSNGFGFGVCAGCTGDAGGTDVPPSPIDGMCVSNCAGRTCGDNGCGGSCGVCPSGQSCNGNTCVAMMMCQPQCAGRMCGPDGCGGMCGTCPSGGSCNPMTGQCCTPNCAGRSCGADGCGGTCGECSSGLVCDSVRGSCTPTCTPSCAGRNCGPNNCGTGSCGTCLAGQVCSPSGMCSSACFARTGDPCTADADCCSDRGLTTRCVRLTGVGQVCTAACASASDCVSGCCVSLTDGTRACNIPLFCASNAACRAPVGGACARDADCCRETAGLRNPTACTCFGSDCSCAALCSQNSDCSSGCCARRDDGVRICARASACG